MTSYHVQWQPPQGLHPWRVVWELTLFAVAAWLYGWTAIIFMFLMTVKVRVRPHQVKLCQHPRCIRPEGHQGPCRLMSGRLR